MHKRLASQAGSKTIEKRLANRPKFGIPFNKKKRSTTLAFKCRGSWRIKEPTLNSIYLLTPSQAHVGHVMRPGVESEHIST